MTRGTTAAASGGSAFVSARQLDAARSPDALSSGFSGSRLTPTTMRKTIVPVGSDHAPPAEDAWLDLAHIARVEITSEESSHPVEGALVPTGGSGWRAALPGPQTLRLLFDSPQTLRRIHLKFVESVAERRQEFVMRWSPDGEVFHEIVRQQWNFSPGGATTETEDYRVDLSSVAVFELAIHPDVSGGDARASLAVLRLA